LIHGEPARAVGTRADRRSRSKPADPAAKQTGNLKMPQGGQRWIWHSWNGAKIWVLRQNPREQTPSAAGLVQHPHGAGSSIPANRAQFWLIRIERCSNLFGRFLSVDKTASKHFCVESLPVLELSARDSFSTTSVIGGSPTITISPSPFSVSAG
jgi:hypothetical protein